MNTSFYRLFDNTDLYRLQKTLRVLKRFAEVFRKSCLGNKKNELPASSSRTFPIFSQFFSVVWAFTASNLIGIETRLDCFRFYRLIAIKLFLFFFTIALNVPNV